MADCLFCRIAAGEIPSAKVWEDDRTFAFLDINPLTRGHALVVPKTHAARLEEASEEDAAAVMRTARRLVPRLCGAVGAQDATVAINNGPHAGQEVPHLHLHIVPRQAHDGAGPVHALFKDRPSVETEDLQRIAAKVRSRVEA